VRILFAALAPLALLFAASGARAADSGQDAEAPAVHKVDVAIDTRAGTRTFHVELARTEAQQARGLMFRTDLGDDGGMLFAPYPGDGGPPRVASFWMKNTPSPLDILFIRPNGTIAKIAANAEPFSERPLGSGEPVSAVLEIKGGRAVVLGIAAGDKVRWNAR
jgi:uncharacterized protein